jgi:hypothetical protein
MEGRSIIRAITIGLQSQHTREEAGSRVIKCDRGGGDIFPPALERNGMYARDLAKRMPTGQVA